MFILDPDPYSLPSYRIGPFRTADLSKNHCLPVSDLIEAYFNERFGDNSFIYTFNGRKAINIALSYYNLRKDDVVSILTTSGNYYISSCVTREIERFCRWNREIVPETKVIFINHEFGYPYKDLQKLTGLNLPVIEDCAASFFSNDKNCTIGRTGDFAIYSFPKMFPIQIGGLLVYNQKNIILDKEHKLQDNLLRYIKNVLSHYIKIEKEIVKQRILNYFHLKSKFDTLNLPERFSMETGSIPGVFMFRTDNYQIDLPELKKHFWAHGVQCSVFYGEKAFFIPVHQALSEHDMDYFYEIMKSFINKTSI
jgi:hypothetical protein